MQNVCSTFQPQSTEPLNFLFSFVLNFELMYHPFPRFLLPPMSMKLADTGGAFWILKIRRTTSLIIRASTNFLSFSYAS